MAALSIEVRLFAQLRVAAGADRLSRTVEPGTTAGALARELLAELGLGGLSDRVVVALDDRYADPGTVLQAGDRLSLVPPVSGGSPRVAVLVTEAPLDASAVLAEVAADAVGATVLFQGTPRDVEALEFEAHASLAEAELRRIGEELAAEHGLEAIALHHRLGLVPAREAAILIVAASAHREAAFVAARAALEQVKQRVPLWKSELDGDAATAVPGEVVTAAAAVGSGSGGSGLGGGEPGGGEPAVALTHLAADGSARMVDVTGKAITDRLARASARVLVSPQTAQLIADGSGPKGEVLAVARLAGVMAAKRTAELVPLAHPLPLTKIDVQAKVDVDAGAVELEALARTTGKTGVEIEALVAVTVAALTVYDMIKAVERHARIDNVQVIEKRGGRHDFAASSPPAQAANGDAAVPVAPPTPVAQSTPASRVADASPMPHAATTSASAPPAPALTLAAVTVSTSRSSGDRPDRTADALAAFLDGSGWSLIGHAVVTDELAAVESAVRDAALSADVVFTLGGTGVTLDDITPEATRAVISREIPGLAEALRAQSMQSTPLAALSRGVAGSLGGTLIINLPGSPRALGELRPLLLAVIPHAIAQLRRPGGDDGAPHR